VKLLNCYHCHNCCAHHTQQAAALSKRVKELQRDVADRERKLEVAIKSDKRWAARMETELSEMRQEVAKHRRAATDIERVKAENDELRRRITTQDEFMRRRFGDAKKAKSG
jgi:predicted RNase H-like nuclease (RuvC/YqgF family)